ncbi:MAG: BPSL0067 family protein [Zoogloeaceae bacterium]|jgi:hypothetical protein|nr:BPSL0067 family protein [Zoogloeaceae bacterium]
MPGPFVYANAELLDGKPYVADIAGNYFGECVSLVKHHIVPLQNVSTKAWKEGVNVIEALKKGTMIAKGTAIATFVNGRFESGHGHAAFYIRHVFDPDGVIRIEVIEQYLGEKPSGGVKKRLLPNHGKDKNGNYINRSNNGRAFSVIML